MVRRPDVDLGALRAVVGRDAQIERTPEGVSRQVYRVERDGRVEFAVVAEEAGEDLTVEARVLDELRALGVPVPEVVRVGPFEDRSILVITEVPGEDLGRCTDERAARAVAREAGRHLASINTIAVDGWGWLDRTVSTWPPRGRDGGDAPAVLAHGDFDCTPIFQRDGRLTGFIDFGELRGAEPSYDLGHFLLHDGETGPFALFDDVVAGYRERAPVDLEAVRASGLALGQAQLDRWHARGMPHDHELAGRRRRQLDRLLVWSPS